MVASWRAAVAARAEALQVIDRVSTRNKTLENLLGMFGIVEAFAALVEPIDQRPLLAGQQQPAFAEFLSAVVECMPGVAPGVVGDFTRGRFVNLNLPVRRLGEELQGGVVGRLLEDLIRFEIDPAVEIATGRNNPSEPLPVFVGGPKTRCDVTQSSVLIEERDAFFDEGQIEVEISGLGARVGFYIRFGSSIAEELCHVGMHRPEILKFHIGRVADDRVEASMGGEDLRERLLPIESIHPLPLALAVQRQIDVTFEKIRVDQAVPLTNVLVEGRQRLVAARRMEPQGKLGDLHGSRIDVDAVDVISQDLGDQGCVVVIRHRSSGEITAQLPAETLDFVPCVEKISESGDQECARPTCGIEDGERL
jgi:hypothetical protein